MHGWTPANELHGRFLRLQPNTHAPRRPREDLLQDVSRDLLLQGHALRLKERWINVSEVGEHDVRGSNRRETMEVYIDDMLVKSLEAEDHISHLQHAFSTLRKYNMKLNPAKCSFGVSFGKFQGYIVTHRGIEANPEQIRAIHSIPSPRNVKEVHKLTGRMVALSRFISMLSDKSHAFFETLKKRKDFEWTEKCELALQEFKAYLTTPPLLSKPLLGEVLLLYLVGSEHAVSAVLVREEGTKQLPIYYVSKALLDAETRYSHLEKLALALMVASPLANYGLTFRLIRWWSSLPSL
ncbi:hypothetical protein Bca4012_073852 [Brassica carinata]